MSDARKINVHNQNLFGGHTGNASHPGNIGALGSTTPLGTIGPAGIRPVMSWGGYVETVADLLAAGIITSENYFKVKALMQSPDSEVRQLGLKFIEGKSKLEI